MQTAQNANRYTPEEPPSALSGPLTELVGWAMRQFRLISAATDTLADGQLEVTTVAPTKPRNGMIRLADGTQWNPGSGRGMYWYDEVGATWRFLG